MNKKTLIIGVIVVIALLAGWRMYAGRVDHTRADSVAGAFLSALKSENIDKAGSFWVPDHAEAWKKDTLDKLEKMQSGTHTRFFEGLPSSPQFTSSKAPKAPANEQTLSTDGATVDMRQIDGKWYVCKAPL